MLQMNEYIDIAHLKAKIADDSPQDILRLALSQFKKIAISFSGAEDVALIDMALKIKDDVNVFGSSGFRLTRKANV